MRTSELKTGERYADCNGRLVVPVDPIRNDWRWQLNDKGVRTNEAVYGDAQEDPWATCSPRTGRAVHKGVLVEVYNFDAAGRRQGDPASRDIIPPRDIKGTWNQFLMLHADDVKRRARERLFREREKAQREELAAIVQDVHLPNDFHLSLSTYGGRLDYKGKATEATYMLTIRESVEERLTYDQARQVIKMLKGLKA